MDSAPRRLDESRSRRCLGILLLLAAVVIGAVIRVQAAARDDNFDVASAEGLLKSDPGLLFYLTERVLDSGGGVPADFRADPRIEHPGQVDVPATFTVGQEFLIAWSYRLFGEGVPLHLFALRLMAVSAALAAVGVFGLARELSRSSMWASFAVALYLVLPASYRTIGFILVREDLSLPLFAVHLWLLARAARLRTVSSVVLAAAFLGAALATWHAMTFFVAIEALVVFLWFLRSGENPFEERAARAVPIVLALFAVAVPALRTKDALLSLPLQLLLALLVAALLGRGRPRSARTAIALAAWAVLFAASFAAARVLGAGAGDFSHVFRLLLAKLRYLGTMPVDPAALSFESRLLWQGPFATLEPAYAVFALRGALLLALPALAAGVWTWVRGSGRREEAVLAGLAVLGLVAAWLVQRVFVLPAILLPPLVALFCARFVGASGGRRRQGRELAVGAVLGAVLIWQAASFGGWLRDLRLAWYEPAVRQSELATLVRELPRFVPEGEAVAGDFMSSTAILAHTGRPIVLQPKWETRESRRRVEAFLTTFFSAPPDELRRMLVEEFDCRYLLVDRSTLHMTRFAAGLREGEALRPGTAAERFLSRDGAVLASVPGFRLLWRSPESLLQSNGQPSDFYRLYALED